MQSSFIKRLLNGEATAPLTELNGRTGVLFSKITLDYFIKEEAIHDDYSLTQNEMRSIRTFSSGEQKKALLNYLLSKKPDFLVLENAFDMLDKASRADLVSRLRELSEKMSIIQVFRRKENPLPFIEHVLHMKDEAILFQGPVEAYKEMFRHMPRVSIPGQIPPAIGDLPPLADPLIDIKNVSVSYGDTCILKDISWTIKKGDFWQLMGPNGAGKTTLLTMITGDNPKAYGQDLTLFGMKKGRGESVWDIKKNIGYVTPAMTVLFTGNHSLEHMVVGGMNDSIGLYRKPSSFQMELAGKWLDFIGLSHVKKVWFSDLSEEQQCMVLIARAMVKHPPLLILDEPTHGLTDDHVSIVTALINKIADQSRTAIIYVSHSDEMGLRPNMIYELIPDKNGSQGRSKTLG